VLLVIVSLGCAAAHEQAREQEQTARAVRQERPNIVFIMSDDHGWQAISAYGSKLNETPNIDRIAREGVRFDRAYVTNSICAPSRAVILTGLHSHLNGVTTNAHRFDGSQRTAPKMLREAGYETALIGKWHLKSEPTGFDHYDRLIGQGPYYNPRMIRDGEEVRREGYTTDIITDLADDWLRGKGEKGRSGDKPFLLMVQHKAPHRNWQPAPRHLTLYDDVEMPEPETLFDDWSGKGSAAPMQEMTIAQHLSRNDLKLVPPGNLTGEQLEAWNAAYGPKNAWLSTARYTEEGLVRWKYQRYVKDYLRCVKAVDEGVGKLLGTLDELGLSENTLVIYTSDQGWFLGEHGWYDKRWMYEESFRTPLVMRWPAGMEAWPDGGVALDQLVQNLDLAPTFLDVAGIEVPGEMQGRSLDPLLKGREIAWRNSLYYRYYEHPAVHMVHRHRGVLTDRYKLMHFYKLDEWELYDLVEDPDEVNNVISDPEYSEVVADLKAELARLEAEYGVTEEADLEVDRMFER
jgi:arylsulfatase A-like enzyme